MGQGGIEFRGSEMMNCRESTLTTIGIHLQRHNNHSDPAMERLISAWLEELATMPPGCSTIRLDDHLTTDACVAKLVRLLESARTSIPKEHREAHRLVDQVIFFITGRHEELHPVHKPARFRDRLMPDKIL